ncbi:S8 family peptidase [Priestia megaterium]|nr:S8 family peptidase [Priestia megaterium]
MNNVVELLPITSVYSLEAFENTPSNILSIGTQEKWKRGFYGKNVVIAVLDTGCETSHPDLKERIIDGYNFTEEHNGDISVYEDLNGHGTHVSGIMAGSINETGIVGVAPKADLLILKVLNKRGTGSSESLIEGINYAINWRGIKGEKVRVISLSLGLKSPNPKLHDAVKRAIENDICVVAASGNDGDGNMATNEYRYPGAYPEVISVGALKEENQLADFSNTHDLVDLYAPGVGIYSTSIKSGHTLLSGTSMAAPHIAGSIALLIEEYTYLFNIRPTEEEIYKFLMGHTSEIQFEDGNRIKMIDLTESVNIRKRNSLLSASKNKDMLLKCFCEARRTQAFFTKCLDENSSEEEREFILELIQNSASTSEKIKEFCQNG